MDPTFWETSFKLPFEDVYFNSYLLNKKLNAIVTNEIFYCYRINNLNSILFNSKKITLIDRIKIINKWFTSSPNWNIFVSLECKEYWISIYLRIILSHGSFKEILNKQKKTN